MTSSNTDHPGDGHDHANEKAGADAHAHGGVFGSNTEVIFALASGAALALGFGLEKLAPGVPAWLPLALYVVAYGFGGFYTDPAGLERVEVLRGPAALDVSWRHTCLQPVHL